MTEDLPDKGQKAPWLSPVLEQLRARRERLPHALLIEGPRGWGADRVANALALDLMDLAPAASKTASEVAHPDLRWIAPEKNVIKVDAVRRAIDFLVQTPQLAGRKIAVIQDADKMNLNAANALLKTLEEPPAESFLALSTGNPGRLLPTVRSRCQRFAIRPVANDALLDWLLAQGVAADAGAYFAVEYGGAPFAVLEAADSEQTPLWPALEAAAGAPAAAKRFVDSHRDADLADLVGRWLRIVCWLLRRLAGRDAAAALHFADDLATTRRIALLNTSLSRPMQLQRLVSLWVRLWPLLRLAGPPRLQESPQRGSARGLPLA